MFSKVSVAALGSFLVASASAGFNSGSASNIAIYWGQNSEGTLDSTAQQNLAYYCANTEFNIVNLAFLTNIITPALNFANSGNSCTAISGSSLMSCPQIAADIITCQQLGKTVMLSMGGQTYSEGGFSSSALAISSATNLWKIFGPATSDTTIPRPFGTSVVDGFDFDFESSTSNMAPFASQLRTLMTASTASTGKTYLLSAAPQCVYPDAADNDMLNGAVSFDFIQVQYYNNGCGASSYVPGATTQWNFNFNQWDTWAKTVSKNPNVKVLMGIAGATGAANSGSYVTPATLAPIITFVQQYSSFGGIMIWEASRLWQNPGFLDAVYADLGSQSTTGTTTVSAVTTATATATSTATTLVTSTKTTTTTSASTTGVAQWGQCGGEGYTGPTVCASPYTCVATGAWWSQCE